MAAELVKPDEVKNINYSIKPDDENTGQFLTPKTLSQIKLVNLAYRSVLEHLQTLDFGSKQVYSNKIPLEHKKKMKMQAYQV